MKRLVKYSLIAAGVCILSGAAIAAVGASFGGAGGFWLDRNGLHSNGELRGRSSAELAELNMTMIEDITSADIMVRNHDIYVEESSDDHFYLEYKLPMAKSEPEYGVTNGKLVFRFDEAADIDSSSRIYFFAFHTDMVRERGQVKLYVPENAFLDQVKLQSIDGKVEGQGFQAGNVDITAQYGSMRLEEVNANQVILNSSDGSMKIWGGEADSYAIDHSYGSTTIGNIRAGSLSIKSNDGSISIEDMEADALWIEHKYGSTKGRRIMAGTLTSHQNDGSFVFEDLKVGQADIKNSYGSVRLELEGREKDYNYDLSTRFGSLHRNNVKYGDGRLQEENGSGKLIKVQATDSSVEINTMEK